MIYSLLPYHLDGTLQAHNLTFEPTRYSFHRDGGPELAEIEVSGPLPELWGLLGWLRGRMVLMREAQPIWWGYLDTVTLNLPGVQIGLSLQSMYNLVRVTYSYVAAGAADVGERKDTSLGAEFDSYNQFGGKSLYTSIAGASDAQAEQLRDTLLAMHSNPRADVRTGGTFDTVSATLSCRGWWDTLSWIYYENTDTASTVTTTQITDMITAYNAINDWIVGTDIVDASGVSSSEYRDSDSTIEDSILELLKTGTTNDLPLQATITQEQKVKVYEQPSRTDVRYYLNNAGELLNQFGQRLTGGECPAGEWCGLWDVRHNSTAAVFLSGASPFMIQRCEYDIKNGRYTIEPVGTSSPWELAQLI